MSGFRRACFLFIIVTGWTMTGCARFGGDIRNGITQEAVEEKLGKPDGFHRRWMANRELREVWVYHDRGPSIKNHLYPDTQVIVFSDGKVVAINPRDPYAPLKTVKP